MREYRIRGFTFIEIIVVMGIMALLATLSLPLVDLLRSTQKENATKEEMENIISAIESYYEIEGDWPESLDALVESEPPYMSRGFYENDYKEDSWINPYDYDSDTLTLYSWGRDETDNQGSYDTDIVYTIVAPPSKTYRKENANREKMEAVSRALMNYYSDMHTFPVSSRGTRDALSMLLENVNGNEWWNGPYISGVSEEEIAVDAWGSAVRYRYEPEYDAFSCELIDSRGNVFYVSYKTRLTEEVKATSERCRNLIGAVQSFIEDTKQTPLNLDELVDDPGLDGWQGPYVNHQLILSGDSWGTPFDYEVYKNRFYIYSWGPNGVDESYPPSWSGDDIWK